MPETPQSRINRRATKTISAPPGYVRLPELARMLDVCELTIRNWEKLGDAPPRTKLGNRLYYSLDSVYAWMKAHERRPRTADGKK